MGKRISLGSCETSLTSDTGQGRSRGLVGVMFFVAVMLVAAVGLVVAGMNQSSQAGPQFAPAPTASAFSVAPEMAPATEPVPGVVAAGRVVVPSVGIDQRLQAGPLEAAGGVVVPPADAVAALAAGAPMDAVSGSTVLAGHVNTDSGGPGPFAPLAGVEAGSVVTVVTADDQRTDWRVVTAQTVSKDGLAPELFASDGPRQLVLITCGGPVTGTVPGTNLPSFDSNVVITAVPVGGR